MKYALRHVPSGNLLNITSNPGCTRTDGDDPSLFASAADLLEALDKHSRCGGRVRLDSEIVVVKDGVPTLAVVPPGAPLPADRLKVEYAIALPIQGTREVAYVKWMNVGYTGSFDVKHASRYTYYESALRDMAESASGKSLIEAGAHVVRVVKLPGKPEVSTL